MSDPTRSNVTGTQPTVLSAGPSRAALETEHQPSATPDLDSTSNKDSFLSRVERIAANLVILKVTTVIGTFESVIGADETHRVTVIKAASNNQQVASISINMALGDTSQVVSQSFVENPIYMKMHIDALVQARAVRQETIELLRTIYKEFRDMLAR